MPTVPIPTSPDPSALRTFLESPARPAGTLSYHALQGFLFTVVSAPEMIPPSEWLPIIFGDAEAGYTNGNEAQAILGQIMALYNTINAAVRDTPALLPADCPLRDDVLANFDDDAPIAQWARGFVRGQHWLEQLWEDLPEELDEELAAVLMTLSFFSSRRLAEGFLAEATTDQRPLEDLAASLHRVLPEAVEQYAHIGQSVHQALKEHPVEGPIRTVKIGRNEPCPCGSGKKYKKCCGGTVH